MISFKNLEDDAPLNITEDANLIWGIASSLRSVYYPHEYGNVIIPMTILRRFECTLEPTKEQVISQHKVYSNTPAKSLKKFPSVGFIA